MVFKGNLKVSDIGEWLQEFQNKVNDLAGLDYLKFTAEVWGKAKYDGKVQKAVTVNGKDSFPYLDMEMYWSKRGDLEFRVHLKVNQQLKYLNRGSTHTKACFQAIPSGVIR